MTKTKGSRQHLVGPQLPPTCVQTDITQTVRFLDIQRRHEEFLKPSKNEIVDLAQVEYSPDGKFVAGVATICKELIGVPPTRLAIIELDSGRISTFGEVGTFDIRPKWSPDGKVISFLSQVDQCCQLHLVDLDTGKITKATALNGTIEHQYWSQDGKSILLTVAGRGADKSGCDGGVSLVHNKDDPTKSWIPIIETPVVEDSYRNAWVYDVSSFSTKQVSPHALNIWHAVWISRNAIAAICSDLPGEEHWYRANLREINIETQTTRVLFENENQIEGIRASPSGASVAFMTSIASDRQIVKGDLYIVDMASGKLTMADTNGVNVGCLEWASNDDIVAVGGRDDEEVVIHYNLLTGKTDELWKSHEHSVGGHYMPEITAIKKNDEIRCAFLTYGWFSPPTFVTVTGSQMSSIKTFSSPELCERIQRLGTCRNLKWKAPDGLEIYGYFLAPPTPGPHPTILIVHGGPVWQWRPRYVGSHGNSSILLDQLLLEEGFAIFKPNVRGSTGRGQEFSRHVYGDMGGKDTYDYLSGLDALVESGQADPKRLGVYGASYGGFMSSWLITQTDRFAAAVPVAPVTNWVSEQYTAHVGRFCKDFLNDDAHNPNGRFFTRSPIHYVRDVKTPALMVCGAQDKNTPPGQALEFHRALVAHGKTSVLLTYPEEGHGVRRMPAFFDFAARAVEWFKYYV
ncbi:hypothetical protein G7Z17_g2798 [Cylindrodendrum hubeiense]|uniref:Dipeptidyl-peptidase V n=1 Tax=Cylindrodendrum hubeiense TaxID=595255 RepID=A0A9P5LJZ8_9HYPO|nr:hypothetical protein G7Z17_g2798 [Cylindrodendrum hubeiense]